VIILQLTKKYFSIIKKDCLVATMVNTLFITMQERLQAKPTRNQRYDDNTCD
jgi:hypothetical protein